MCTLLAGCGHPFEILVFREGLGIQVEILHKHAFAVGRCTCVVPVVDAVVRIGDVCHEGHCLVQFGQEVITDEILAVVVICKSGNVDKVGNGCNMIARIEFDKHSVIEELLVELLLEKFTGLACPGLGILEFRHKDTCCGNCLKLGNTNIGIRIICIADEFDLMRKHSQDCAQPGWGEIIRTHIIREYVYLGEHSFSNLKPFPLIIHVVFCTSGRRKAGVLAREFVEIEPGLIYGLPVLEISFVTGCTVDFCLGLHPLVTMFLIAEFLAGDSVGHIFPIYAQVLVCEGIIDFRSGYGICGLIEIADVETGFKRLIRNILLACGEGGSHKVYERIHDIGAVAVIVQKFSCSQPVVSGFKC